MNPIKAQKDNKCLQTAERFTSIQSSASIRKSNGL